MRNLVNLTFDPTAVRQDAERQLEHARAIEQAYTLAALAKRLHGHRKLFARHNLFLAFKPEEKYPALYIVKRDHSAWARIWWCVDALRLDASSAHSSTDWYEVMDVRLTANLDFAEKCLLGMVERDELRFGNAYLPGDLHELDRVSMPAVPALPPPPPQVPQLPAPTGMQRSPARLQAVPLPDQPKPR